jgi:hypothetical protein
LHVISRTDSVKDRLAAFYHWDDRSSLATALSVAAGGQIDLTALREWSVAEGSLSKFKDFERRFNPLAAVNSRVL